MLCRHPTHPTVAARGRARGVERRSPRRSALLAAGVLALTIALTAAPASGQPQAAPAPANGLALTPYMGVDTWYAFGKHIDEHTIVGLANAIASRGLRSAGYRYLWMDSGWWDGARGADGTIALDPHQWPQGLAWLTAYLHAKGLRAGIYTDAGPTGCAKSAAGSYGHYQTDVNTFAAWGFDAVKVDFCGGRAAGLDQRIAFSQFAAATYADSPHRPILLGICDAVTPGSLGGGEPSYDQSAYGAYRFGPAIANSWRTGPDIGGPGQVGFSGVLRNLDSDALHPQAAGPGHWNDPDYIVPDAGMTAAQAQAQFSLWAILAAPLMLSDDVRTMPHRTLAMVTNREAIAIDQDPLGAQGRRVARSGTAEVWVRRLANGDQAVALLNRGAAPVTVRATARLLGLRAASSYRLRDVWAHRTTRATGAIKERLAGESAVLLRVSPG